MADRNHRIRFMGNNTSEAEATSAVASSAQSQYPLTNVTQDKTRYRTWRPEGNFTIDATNQNFYINDGSDKTATITAGDYLPSTLATEIQTQLNAVSSNWTVGYNTSTNKFTVSNTGSVTIKPSNQTNAIWDTIGFTGITDQTSTSFTPDARRNHTSESIVWDLGIAREITFFAMVGPLDEVFSLGTPATITLSGNNINDFTSPDFTTTLTASARGIYAFLDATENTEYRYWKFEFVDKVNPLGPTGFKFGHIYLGDYITLESRNLQTGFDKTRVDQSGESVAESGARFYNIRPKVEEFSSLVLPFLESADRLELEQFFYEQGIHEPFYISMDPTLMCSTSIDELTRYVRFSESPTLTHIRYNFYTLGFAVREVV